MVKQRVIAMLPRIFAIVAVVVILGAALGAGSALAAKGGNGKGKGNGNGGHGNKTVATMTVSPDPVAAYTHPTVSGTGFKAGKEVLVGIPGDLRFTRVTPDRNGAFSFLYTARNLAPATYTMEAWVAERKGKWVLEASATFTVVP